MFVKLIIGFIVGIVGSMLINHYSDILPLRKPIFAPPVCQYCSSRYSVGRYIFGLPCRSCSANLTLRHAIVIFLFTTISNLFILFPIGKYPYWMDVAIVGYSLIVLVIDIEHHLVLHKITFTGAIVMLVIGTSIHGISRTLIGGISGFIIMFVLFLLGGFYVKVINKIRNSEYRDTALGFGDVTLSGVMGLLLGWPGITGGLLVAIVLGGGYSLIYLLINIIKNKYQAYSAIPYAPFIVLGSLFLVYLPN